MKQVSDRRTVSAGHNGCDCAINSRAGLCPEAVTLEITESVIVTEDSRTDEILAELKHTGVRLAIDDFGTGYSSLAYLGRLPIDVLKVDRSFISGLGGAGRDSAIVSAMVDLAHNPKTGRGCRGGRDQY